MAHPDLSFAHKMAGGSCLEGPGECVASGSLQQPGECVFVDGPAQKITLHFMALIFTQETELFLGLHAFCGHRQPHRLSKADDRLYHCTIILTVADGSDEPFVDLDAVKRVGAQVTE